MPDSAESLQRLFVALLAGLLVGLDRERAEQRKQRKLFAGIRTFPLIALVAAALSLPVGEIGPWPLIVGFAAVAMITLQSYRRSTEEGAVGATTEMAALATYTLGVLAGLGALQAAGAGAVAVAVLLAAKPPLERLSRALSEEEITAVLKLAVISAIVLPLVPDQGYGPWQVWNPYRIWRVVVLVSAVSFAGFLATRWKGRDGLFWAAGLGALVSSTAVTVAMAQRSKQQPGSERAASAAAVLASVIMCGRVLVLVGITRPPLLTRLAPAVLAMAAVGLVAALLLRRGARAEQADEQAQAQGQEGDREQVRTPENPFSVRAAILFGALFAGVLLLVRGSQELFGDKGTLLAAVLSGFVDVDAISLAIARGADEGFRAAALAITVACAANNLFKAGVAVVSGGGRFRRDVALTLVAMGVTGVAVVSGTNLWW